MKLQRLHVTGFGALIDTKIEGLGDDHILVVEGPNETGKSTLREAIVTLFADYSAPKIEAWSYRRSDGQSARLVADFQDERGSYRIERILGAVRESFREQDGRRVRLNEDLVSLDRERLEILFAPTDRELLRSSEALAQGTDPRLFGASRGVDPLEAAAALRREAASYWRPDRRGRPLHREMEVEIAELRRRRSVALSRRDRRRDLADEEMALRQNLAEGAQKAALARERLELLRRRDHEQRADLKRRRHEDEEALRRGRYATNLLRRREVVERALDVLATEGMESDVSLVWQRALGEADAKEDEFIEALGESDLANIEARCRLRRDGRRLRRSALVALFVIVAGLGFFDVLSPGIALGGLGLIFVSWLFTQHGEDDRRRADFCELSPGVLHFLVEDEMPRGAFARWRRLRDLAENQGRQNRRDARDEKRRAKAREALEGLAQRTGLLGDAASKASWDEAFQKARNERAEALRARRRHRDAQGRGLANAGESVSLAVLGEELAALDHERSEQFERLGALREEYGRLAAEEEVDDVEGELRSVIERREETLFHRDQLTLAAALIEEATRGFRDDVEPKVLAASGQHLATLTAGRYNEVIVDEEGKLELRGPQGRRRSAAAPTSRGTREQLGFSLRLALAEIVDPRGTIPFVFDEIFVHWDGARRRRAWSLLARVAKQRPVILMTCHEALANEASRYGRARRYRLLGAENSAEA